MRFLFAVTLLFSGCAHLAEKPARETPGAKLYLRDPNGDGRRQWFLRVIHTDETDATPSLIFDEEDPSMPPPLAPVTLTSKPFVPGVPQPGYYLSYRLMVLTGHPPEDRGVVYMFGKETAEAFPLLWWGLTPDPRFDDASPADNWAKLQALFKKP